MDAAFNNYNFGALRLFRIKKNPRKNIILLLKKISSASYSVYFSQSLMFLRVFLSVSFSSNVHYMFSSYTRLTSLITQNTNTCLQGSPGLPGVIKINLCIVDLIFAQFYFHVDNEENNSNWCNVQVNKKVGSGENTLCPVWNQIFINILVIVFCRIVFSTRGKVIPLSVLLTKATFIWRAAPAASDGSSRSMAPSAVVHCLLMSFGGWQALVITATNQEQ